MSLDAGSLRRQAREFAARLDVGFDDAYPPELLDGLDQLVAALRAPAARIRDDRHPAISFDLGRKLWNRASLAAERRPPPADRARAGRPASVHPRHQPDRNHPAAPAARPGHPVLGTLPRRDRPSGPARRWPARRWPAGRAAPLRRGPAGRDGDRRGACAASTPWTPGSRRRNSPSWRSPSPPGRTRCGSPSPATPGGWPAATPASPTGYIARRCGTSAGSAAPGSASQPRQWLLKMPFHLAEPRALVAAYPDAVFIQTHRSAGGVPPVLAQPRRVGPVAVRAPPGRHGQGGAGRGAAGVHEPDAGGRGPAAGRGPGL